MNRDQIVILAMSFLLATPAAFPQQVPNAAPGFRPEGVYDFAGIDQVGIFQGALSVSIPLGLEFPIDGGLSYRLAARYSSSLWNSHTYPDPCTTPSECPNEMQPKSVHNAGLGWRVSLGNLFPPANFFNQTGHWSYVSENGSEHVLYPTLHLSDPEDPVDVGIGPASQLVLYSRDGSYLRASPSSTARPTHPWAAGRASPTPSATCFACPPPGGPRRSAAPANGRAR